MNIIDRIKKLHALAERNSSTEEAASAAAKIQELCFKHNLELEEIVNAGGDQNAPHVRFDYLMPETTRTDVGWKRTLFGGIAKANFCQPVYIPGTTQMAVVGQKHNFDAVVYTFEYLTREIQRLAIQESRDQRFLSNKERRRYMQGFCEGAASTLYQRLTASFQQQARQTAESRELVVVKDRDLDAAVKIHFPRLHRASRRATGSTGGFSHGRTAANSITVNRGIGSKSRTLIN
jgi:hypothetical protein